MRRSEEGSRLAGRPAAAVAGALGAAAALGVGELLASVLSAVPSLVVGVGALVVDLVPAPLEDFAIRTFGTADKPALLIGIVVLSLTFGTLLGL
ncbi:MAG TPA: molybdopterin-binding oxidoreductase, partial [Actinomycetota bacterium]|nr:molybdopterin-binding oxidoreductase [Actinomycetota bacterium]